MYPKELSSLVALTRGYPFTPSPFISMGSVGGSWVRFNFIVQVRQSYNSSNKYLFLKLSIHMIVHLHRVTSVMQKDVKHTNYLRRRCQMMDMEGFSVVRRASYKDEWNWPKMIEGGFFILGILNFVIYPSNVLLGLFPKKAHQTLNF